jgi:hypothetical protein
MANGQQKPDSRNILRGWGRAPPIPSTMLANDLSGTVSLHGKPGHHELECSVTVRGKRKNAARSTTSACFTISSARSKAIRKLAAFAPQVTCSPRRFSIRYFTTRLVTPRHCDEQFRSRIRDSGKSPSPLSSQLPRNEPSEQACPSRATNAGNYSSSIDEAPPCSERPARGQCTLPRKPRRTQFCQRKGPLRMKRVAGIPEGPTRARGA